MHERIYTIKDEADIGGVHDLEGARHRRYRRQRAGAARRCRRSRGRQSRNPAAPCSWASSGRQEVPVYDGTVLGTGAVIDGPALIEQPTTTMLLLAKQQARTDDHGNFLVEQR